MNPVQSLETPQLYGHSMHAGGWPKLGWELLTEQEFFLESQDESASPDEAVNQLFS